MTPVAFRVERSKREVAGVRTLEIAPVGEPLPAAAPGQFNMLYAFGVGEVAISVSGMADGRTVHTVRDVGAVTRALCALKRHSTLGVRGPFGTPWPMESAKGKDVLVIAGGVGMAPLRPVVAAIAADRDAYGKVTLVYATRSPALILFRRELEKTADKHSITLLLSVDHATPDWKGHVGSMVGLLPGADFDREQAIAMTCGPEAMMRFVASELSRQGLTSDRLYVSLERNMQCGIGMCGHCQLGPEFVCKDGPVFRYDRAEQLMATREL